MGKFIKLFAVPVCPWITLYYSVQTFERKNKHFTHLVPRLVNLYDLL